MENDIDLKLYNEYLNGEKSAFEILYNKYKNKIQYFIYNIIKDYQKAEDITQEVFIYVIQNKIKEGYTFKYYIYLVAKCRAYNYVDSENRKKEIHCRMKGSKLKQTVIKQSYLLPLLLMVVLLAGCKTSKVVKTTPVEPAYLSSKLQLTVPNKNGSMTVSGSMKMKSGERIQLSVLMPVFRSEVMRMEVTPDEVLLIDRMNKRYVRATRDELKGILPENADFVRLEKLLFKASLPGEKKELTGRELGIPSLEKAKVRLSDFSTAEFELIPTEVSSRYTQVALEDLLKMLMKL